MLFYASLFLFCVALSAISLWFYRSLNAIGKAAYRAFLPSSKTTKAARNSGSADPAATFNDVLVPWGWGPGTRIHRARQKPATPVPEARPTVPWGWPGNGRNRVRVPVPAKAKPELEDSRRDAPEPGQNHVGWPYREEAFELAAQAHRDQQRSGPAKKRNIGEVLRPWGW